MRRIAYVNARLLDPATGLDAPGGLITEGSVILDVGAGLPIPPDADPVDCTGLCLAPGLVDLRVHVGEPGFEPRETIATAGAAAAAGGITSLVALPETDPPLDDVAGLEFIARRAREEKLVKIYAYAAVTRGLKGAELTDMGLLAQAGAVGFTEGGHALADALVLRRALSYARAFGGVIVQHPEEPSLAAGGVASEGELATRLGLPGIPACAEAIQIARDLRLAQLTGGRLHFAHVTTAEGLALIRQAKAEGISVTCDTAPFYFGLSEIDITGYRTAARLSPPLRAESDRQAVVAALADGTIDAIASDHCPHDWDMKRQPFAQAAIGAVGLETLLPLTLELVHKGQLSLLAALRLLTAGPADVLGLRAGRLAPGAPADFILFDPDRPWRIDSSAFRSKGRTTPFDGRPAMGKTVKTVVDGRVIYKNGGPDDLPRGAEL